MLFMITDSFGNVCWKTLRPPRRNSNLSVPAAALYRSTARCWRPRVSQHRPFELSSRNPQYWRCRSHATHKIEYYWKCLSSDRPLQQNLNTASFIFDSHRRCSTGSRSQQSHRLFLFLPPSALPVSSSQKDLHMYESHQTDCTRFSSKLPRVHTLPCARLCAWSRSRPTLRKPARLSTVMNADNIAVMDKGRLVEQGTHDNLMEAGGVYSSLVARQVPASLPARLPVYFWRFFFRGPGLVLADWCSFLFFLNFEKRHTRKVCSRGLSSNYERWFPVFQPGLSRALCLRYGLFLPL